MKRLQIMIDVDLDEALAVEARRTNTSKAELIRRYVRERLGGGSDSGVDRTPARPSRGVRRADFSAQPKTRCRRISSIDDLVDAGGLVVV